MINKVLGSNFTTKKILATETLGESSHLRKSILDYFGLRFILLGGLVMPHQSVLATPTTNQMEFSE